MGKKEIDYLYYHKKLFAELEEKTAKEKKADIERLTETQNRLLTEKKSLESKEKGISRKIKDLKINIRRVRAMVGVWILVPFLGGGAGYAIGSTSCQYKATTKIYNMKTNEQIGKPEETYTGENYYYKIVVKKGFPWEKKIDSNGYTREVLEYEYIERHQDKEPDIESILQSVKPTYYREQKEALDENDMLDQPEIIITESNLDTTERRPDHDFALAFGILCFLILSLLTSKNQIKGILSDSDIKKLKKDLENAKITKKTIRNEYLTLRDKIIQLQEEHQEKTDIYNGFELELNPELLTLVKKYANKAKSR